MPKSSDYQFAGFHGPRYTMVPNDLFDELLPELSGNEVKVLLYIVRRTFGFQKDADAISLDQFVNGITKRDGTVLDRGAGVSRQGAIEATKSLVLKGIIRAIAQVDDNGGSAPTLYQLRFIDGGQESGLRGSRNPTPGSPKSRREGVQKLDPQYTESQNKEEQDSQNDVASVENDAPASEDAAQATAALPYSAWIGAVITEYSREFKELANSSSNVDKAIRLWKSSLLSEAAFIDLLQQARVATRKAQSGRGTASKMELFFQKAKEIITSQ